MEGNYELIIIGGGPIGLACAIEAQRSGINCLIIEKGCLVNSLFNYPVNMAFFSTSERLEIGNVPFISNHAKPQRSEALEYYRRVAQSYQLPVHLFETVRRVESDTGSKKVVTDRAVYRAAYIIIATGFYDLPFLLNIPGEDLRKVKHYYDDPHFYAFQDVVVVGAMNSAVDAALETWRKGARVTMVIRGAEIGKRVKYWVRPDIENRIREGSIKAYFNSTLAHIGEHDVSIHTPGGPVRIKNDWVLAMTGYQPDLDFLQRAGIELSGDEVRKPHHNEQSYETNVPGIYVAGVICGGMDTHSLFIENAREHAEKIMSDINRKKQL